MGNMGLVNRQQDSHFTLDGGVCQARVPAAKSVYPVRLSAAPVPSQGLIGCRFSSATKYPCSRNIKVRSRTLAEWSSNVCNSPTSTKSRGAGQAGVHGSLPSRSVASAVFLVGVGEEHGRIGLPLASQAKLIVVVDDFALLACLTDAIRHELGKFVFGGWGFL